MDSMLYAMQESNNEGRKAAEKAFTVYRSSNPQECAKELMQCLISGKLRDPGSELLCTVLLRQFTARYRNEAWSGDAVNEFRRGLCEAASRNGLSQSASRQLQFAMASEAATAGWPELCRWALDGLSRSEDSALQLVTCLANEGDTNIGQCALEVGQVIYNAFFVHSAKLPIKLQSMTIEAVAALAINAASTEKNSEDIQKGLGQMLLLPCLQACTSLVTAETDDTTPLEALLEAAIEAPAFFSSDLDAVVAVSRRCALDSGRLELSTGRVLFDISITLAERLAENFFTQDRMHCLRPGKALLELALQAAAARPPSIFWFQSKCPVSPLADEEDENGEHQDEFMATVATDTSLKRLAALAPAARSQMLEWVNGVCGASEATLVRAALAALHAVTLADPSALSEWRGTQFGIAFATDALRRQAHLAEALEACRVLAAIGTTCNLDDEVDQSNILAEAAVALAALGHQCATQGQVRLAGTCAASLALLLNGDDDDDDEDNYEEYEDDDEDLGAIRRATVAGQETCLALLSTTLDSGLRRADSNLTRHCLDAVAVIASKAGRRFEAFYPNFMPPLMMLLEAPTTANNTFEAGLVRAAAATSAARIGAAVGRTRFGTDANRVLAAAMRDIRREFVQGQNHEQDGEVLLNDLVPTGMRLARLDPDLVVPVLAEIAAPLLFFATEQTQVWNMQTLMPGEVHKEESSNTAQKKKGVSEIMLGDDLKVSIDLNALWKKEKASELLGQLCHSLFYRLPDDLARQIAHALLPNVTMAGAPGTRCAALVALGHLCGAVVAKFRRDPTSQKALVIDLVLNSGIISVATALQSETKARPRASAAQALATIIEHISDAAPGGFETAKCSPLAADIAPLIEALGVALAGTAAKAIQEDQEEKDESFLEDDDDNEAYAESLHSNIVNGLSALFKLAPKAMAHTFEASIAPVYGPHLASPDDPIYESALCVFADALQYLPSYNNALGPGVAAAAANALSNSDLTHLHATAAYVVAVVARATPNNAISPAFRQVFPVLQRLTFEEEATEAGDAGYRIRDNAANALYALAQLPGFIPSLEARSQLIGAWIQQALPLRRDMEEARRANRSLLELCQDPVLSAHARAKLAQALEAAQQKPDEFNDFPDPPEAAMDQHIIQAATAILSPSPSARAVPDPKQSQIERRPLTSMAPNVS